MSPQQAHKPIFEWCLIAFGYVITQLVIYRNHVFSYEILALVSIGSAATLVLSWHYLKQDIKKNIHYLSPLMIVILGSFLTILSPLISLYLIFFCDLSQEEKYTYKIPPRHRVES
jgi:hypothetical protein